MTQWLKVQAIGSVADMHIRCDRNVLKFKCIIGKKSRTGDKINTSAAI